MSFTSFRNRPFAIKILNSRIYELLQQAKRLDGRSPYEYRKITIQTNVIDKANGSALVSLGSTKILAGIKAELGAPFPDRPNEGVFSVNAELLPLASASFEPGPPDERGIELARVVDRCIREGKAIDLEKLCLIPGKEVYVMYIDIYVLDYDGNYFDPSLMAAMAALATCKLPKYEVQGDKIVEVENEKISVPIRNVPLSVTIGIIKDKILVDPNLVEESSLDTSIIIGMDNESRLVGIQKNAPGDIPFNMIESILRVAEEQNMHLRRIFKEAVGIA